MRKVTVTPFMGINLPFLFLTCLRRSISSLCLRVVFFSSLRYLRVSLKTVGIVHNNVLSCVVDLIHLILAYNIILLSFFQLQDTKTSTGETEVKFQVSSDTLGSMLRSMAYIRERL